MVDVVNPADSRVDDFRHLNTSDRRPDLPGGKGLVIAEGPLVIGRLLRSRFPVRRLVGFPAKVAGFLEEEENARLVVEQGVEVLTLERDTLAAVAGFDMHRGLLASADRSDDLTVAEAIAGARTIAVLEGVGDHENIGSMFRNAAGLGVDAIIFGNGCADPLYRRVVRVSMGHVLRTPWARMEGSATRWHHGLTELSAAGFHLVSLTPDPAAAQIADALVDSATGRPWEKIAFLVGAEGPGLTERTMRVTDVRARIPMAPGTDSLNLATAAAIAFYERERSLRLV